MPKFPKEIFVCWDGDGGDDPYLIADATLPEPDETTEYAVYQLVKTGKVEVSRRFVENPKR